MSNILVDTYSVTLLVHYGYSEDLTSELNAEVQEIYRHYNDGDDGEVSWVSREALEALCNYVDNGMDTSLPHETQQFIYMCRNNIRAQLAQADKLIDVKIPAPGPWRMPTDAERRTWVMFVHPFKSVTSVCELNPDLEQHTDATMRLIAAAPEMHDLLKRVLAGLRDKEGWATDIHMSDKIEAIMAKIEGQS